jgi:DNA-directed RNA polymerase specialized sigma24 family protein
MRSSLVRTGFTAWVENLAREQTDGLVAAVVGAGIHGEDGIDAVAEAFTAFLKLPQARALAEHRADAGALLAVLAAAAVRVAQKRQRGRAESQGEGSGAVASAAEEAAHAATAAGAVGGAAPGGAPRPHVSEDSPSAATLIAAAEAHLISRGCGHKVADIQRAVVRLRMLEELAGGEAVRSLALRGGALAARLQLAKEALQRCLAD